MYDTIGQKVSPRSIILIQDRKRCLRPFGTMPNELPEQSEKPMSKTYAMRPAITRCNGKPSKSSANEHFCQHEKRAVLTK